MGVGPAPESRSCCYQPTKKKKDMKKEKEKTKIKGMNYTEYNKEHLKAKSNPKKIYFQ